MDNSTLIYIKTGKCCADEESINANNEQEPNVIPPLLLPHQ